MRMLLLMFACAACGSLERAAARDPMKCERDPSCAGKSGKSKDCATQCADNIDCMERCEAVRGARQ